MTAAGGGAPDRPLAGRTAVVTGASRGIGRATVGALLDAGARVAGVSRTGAASHPDEIALACDLTDPAALARTIDAAARALGQSPDIVVNNAGAFAVAPVDETPVSVFDDLIALNLIVPFRLTRAWLAAMRERGHGHLVFVGSIADHRGFPGNGAYSASKFGLRGLHEVLRAELAGTDVRTTLVSPAAVDTPLWDGLDAATRDRFPAASDMLDPAAVAHAILYAVTRPPGTSIDEIRLSRA